MRQSKEEILESIDLLECKLFWLSNTLREDSHSEWVPMQDKISKYGMYKDAAGWRKAAHESVVSGTDEYANADKDIEVRWNMLTKEINWLIRKLYELWSEDFAPQCMIKSSLTKIDWSLLARREARKIQKTRGNRAMQTLWACGCF